MDNSLQMVLTGVVGLNTVATFSVAFFVGLSWGDLNRWRAGVDETLKVQGLHIEALQRNETRAAVVDSQLTRQGELIKLLGRRTHDLRNILQACSLVPKGRDVEGFDEPVIGG